MLLLVCMITISNDSLKDIYMFLFFQKLSLRMLWGECQGVLHYSTLSSECDCTTRTTPNSPIPSAGKGRYYTP